MVGVGVGNVLAGLTAPVAAYFTRRMELKAAETVRRLELAEAVHAARLKAAAEGRQLDAEWERLAIQNAGWKDEYWTMALSVPLVLCFVPAFAPDVAAGFAVLESTPEWYRYSVGVAIAAAFGVRPLLNVVRGRK